MTLPRVTTGGRPPINCANYGVLIVDKVSRATVARLPEVGWDLTYDYRIDRTSEATLTVNVGPGGVGEECCERLGRVGHWMHELVVYREGNNREVWGGPVTKLLDSPGRGTFTIQAKDRSAWWWRRAITRDLVYSGGTATDATRVFMDLLKEAEQVGGTATWRLPYDPVRLNVEGRETSVIVDGKVLTASDIVIVGPEISSLADSVIDWTVIGRTCYVGSMVIELDPLPILAQDHWLEQDPEIEWDGETVATKVVCLGARGIRGEYPLGQVAYPRWPQYGSHIKRISDPKITDQAVADERARSAWELYQQPTLCVVSAGGSLGPNAPVTPEDLIPGRIGRVGFDTSCFVTSVRLAQTRALVPFVPVEGAPYEAPLGPLQYQAYDSGVPRDLVVAQRLVKTTVRVEDSQEVSVLVDLQPPGTDVLRRPGTRVQREAAASGATGATGGGPPPGACLVGPASAFIDGEQPENAPSSHGDTGGYCSSGGYWKPTLAQPIGTSLTLTSDEADAFNTSGITLRISVNQPAGSPPVPDDGQVVLSVNGVDDDLAGTLLPLLASGDPGFSGAPSQYFTYPSGVFVAGSNVIGLTLVSLNNSGAVQTIEALNFDQIGFGEMGVSLFTLANGCMSCTDEPV